MSETQRENAFLFDLFTKPTAGIIRPVGTPYATITKERGASSGGADITGSPGIEGPITYYKTAEGKLIALDCSRISSLDLKEDEEPFYIQFAIIPENKED